MTARAPNRWLRGLGRLFSAPEDVDASLGDLQRETLTKGWQTRLPVGEPVHGLRSLQFDPFALIASMGYKDRRTSLSYDVLRRMSQQLTVVAAILTRRINQVAAFSAPHRLTRSVGFEIKHRDPEHQTTRSEKLLIKQLEDFIARCGKRDAIREVGSPGWDDFESFLRKLVRDSLTFDQACIELVPDLAGRPCAFMAVDASTVRLAISDDDLARIGLQRSADALRPILEAQALGPYGRPRRVPPPDRVDYVQLFQGQIVNAYSRDELVFAVRNPRTDLHANGYGFSELEQLVLTVTSLLWAEEYNRNFFRNGSIPKGILNFKTDTPDPESLEAFKTYWTAQMTGVQNAWRLPMFQSEGLEYINLQASNRDMEFTQWVEYLLKLATALYGMNPAEINFDVARGGSAQPLFETQTESRIADSKENGLRPLLRFIARTINRHILWRIDDRFSLDFVGLDELSETEKMQIRTQEITTYKMIDEVRAEADLPPLPDGSGQVVLNPVWAQLTQARRERTDPLTDNAAPNDAVGGSDAQFEPTPAVAPIDDPLHEALLGL